MSSANSSGEFDEADHSPGVLAPVIPLLLDHSAIRAGRGILAVNHLVPEVGKAVAFRGNALQAGKQRPIVAALPQWSPSLDLAQPRAPSRPAQPFDAPCRLRAPTPKPLISSPHRKHCLAIHASQRRVDRKVISGQTNTLGLTFLAFLLDLHALDHSPLQAEQAAHTLFLRTSLPLLSISSLREAGNLGAERRAPLPQLLT